MIFHEVYKTYLYAQQNQCYGRIYTSSGHYISFCLKPGDKPVTTFSFDATGDTITLHSDVISVIDCSSITNIDLAWHEEFFNRTGD